VRARRRRLKGNLLGRIIIGPTTMLLADGPFAEHKRHTYAAYDIYIYIIYINVYYTHTHTSGDVLYSVCDTYTCVRVYNTSVYYVFFIHARVCVVVVCLWILLLL